MVGPTDHHIDARLREALAKRFVPLFGRKQQDGFDDPVKEDQVGEKFVLGHLAQRDSLPTPRFDVDVSEQRTEHPGGDRRARRIGRDPQRLLGIATGEAVRQMVHREAGLKRS
jgi:hypothetical protein